MISENLTRPKLRKLKRKNILRQATQILHQKECGG